MTTRDSKSDQPGYRGALPTRNDRLARPWILAVFLIFIAIMVLSFLEVPSRFVPEPTPLPVPSIPATPSPSATESPSAEPTDSASASGSASASASASPTSQP